MKHMETDKSGYFQKGTKQLQVVLHVLLYTLLQIFTPTMSARVL